MDINDGNKLNVVDDETNHKVKIVFYKTTSPEYVTDTDVDDEYELEVDMLNMKISSIHGELILKQDSNNNGLMLPLVYFDDPHKENGGSDIDALINDMERLFISA